MSFFSDPFLRTGGLLVFTLASAASAPSCATSAGSSDDGTATGGLGGAIGDEKEVQSLAFLPAEPLLVAPRASRELVVQVTPPGFHRVSFSLVADEGGSEFDGFLESADTVTDEFGIARIGLVAPSRPGVFVVRASAKTVSVEREVSVGKEGFANLLVQPSYVGEREVSGFTAVAHLDMTCADLEDPWGSGDVIATSEAEIRLSNLPVVQQLAVVARAGHFISGCATVKDLVGDEVRSVTIPVSDRPLQLEGTTVPVVLGIEERTAAFVSLLEAAAQLGADAAAGAYPGQPLLLSMKDEVPTGSVSDNLSAWIDSDDASQEMATHFAKAVEPREAILQMLLSAGAKIAAPQTLTFSLQFSKGSAVLELDSAIGVPASRSGFLGSSAVSYEIDPGDGLVLGGDVKFQPTQFLWAIANLATFPASNSEEGRTAEQVLAEVIDCPTLGTRLADVLPSQDCDEGCYQTACEAGVSKQWQKAGSAGDELVSLRIGVTATASVDSDAHPTELNGSWVGSMEAGALSVAGPVGTNDPPPSETP